VRGVLKRYVKGEVDWSQIKALSTLIKVLQHGSR
jgi:hypothetical protein